MKRGSASDPEWIADLSALHAASEGRPVTIGEVEAALRRRGLAAILVVLAAPFCFLPVPGLSTPSGIVVSFIGVCIAIGNKPWLPRFVRRRKISGHALGLLIKAAVRLTRLFQKVSRERLSWFLHGWGMTHLIGLEVALCGLLLLLPLPIPFSNTIPAWAVVFLAAGVMEADGLLIVAGHLIAFAGWGYLVFLWFLGVRGVHQLWRFWA